MASSSARSPRGRMASSSIPSSPPGHGRASSPATLLGFQFRDPSLFERALVHRSYCNEHELEATDSYERLEFLGDAVLELVISARLYQQFPEADEGQLTKSRSSLVRGKVLAGVARRLRLGEMLLVGHGVEASCGRDQDSVLAAVFEAVVAAVYLDQGLEAAREFIHRNLAPELADITQHGAPPENPKSRLQELLQGQGRPTPAYRMAGRVGPDHSPVFRVEALVADRVIGMGQGGKKSDAERAAAEAALDLLSSDSFSWEDGTTPLPRRPDLPDCDTGQSHDTDAGTAKAGGILKKFRLGREV